MRQYICDFCGKKIPIGTGITYVKTDGTELHFCSLKCKKNRLVLKRDPRKYKWTTKHVKSVKIKRKRK